MDTGFDFMCVPFCVDPTLQEVCKELMKLIQWKSLAPHIHLDSPMSHCLKLIDDAHGTKPVNIVAASDKGWCQGRAPQNNARWLSVAAILCPQQRAVEMSRNLNINDGLAGAGEPQMTVFGSLQLWLWF